ncbi:hypothetical protein LMG23992_01195 [Cupriavidus laharis]|uniref:Uncharacterized protein n=1 Tax=Cupriavidus laharis TaxID=151654 RepID=A0ABM8WMH4_9BURK|nr:hypothetical protein [Cupriavidus laharis]CAG9168570.1 hypothetical protein LMG23992_01195 [Cupriavidus laharis]
MEPLSFEFVSVEEAKQVLDGAPPAQAQPDWPSLRRPVPPETLALTPTAMRWLVLLPVEARPMELCRRYPRIGNQLAALWSHPTAIRVYLEDLLIDKRGGRQGFPGGIALELSRLQEYLQQSQP